MTADAVVIGAGIAGLKIARCLARRGLRTVIAEGDQVGAGASSRNQGSINHGPSLGYQECVRLHSREVAINMWRLGLENHRLIREELAEFDIACDYGVGGFTFLVRSDSDGWEERAAEYRGDAELLRADGFDVDFLDADEAQRTGGSPRYRAGLRYNADAQFHSGKYVCGLAQGVARLPNVSIYEGVRVHAMTRQGTATRVQTDRGDLDAPLVFLATNALVPQYVPRLEQSLRAERGQVLVTEPLVERPCRGSFGTSMAWWREIPQPDGRFRLLFGGGRTRDEPDSLFPQFTREGRPHPQLEAGGFSASVEHQARLDAQLATLFPHLGQVRVTHRWGGLQSFTADNLPLVGRLDEEHNLWGIAGFCGRGNCHANIGAEYIAGQALGDGSDVERRYGTLFQTLMQVDRPSARWGVWRTKYEE